MAQTIETFKPFKTVIHIITNDNGKEFAGNNQIAKQLDINFYFAHTYHSWECGANENTKALLRSILPKKN